MTDDQFLQEADVYGGGYFPQSQADRAQAERLEREGYLSGFLNGNNLGLPPEKLYKLTAKGRARVPRYQ